MKKEDFSNLVSRYAEVIAQIRESAHACHAHVNQMYDKQHPYGFHLDMVAEGVKRYGHTV